MIWKRETFAVCDGMLCVKYETTFSDKPVKVTHYWPIMPWENVKGVWDSILGAEAHDQGQGLYYWRVAPFQYENLRLTEGGQTKPIKTETQELPQPKAKTEVRWYWGEWQKYLKSKGWVSIGVNA